MKKILFSLICAFAMSMTAFAATETTVYYAIPDATVGTYTVKLNVCLEWNKPDPNQEPVAVWQQFDMQKTDKTFNANPIYKVTFTDKWDGANTMQFQLYDGEQWKSQEVAFDGSSNGEWTTADTYNGKMRVFGTDGWQAYQEDGAVTPDPVKFYIVGNTNLMGEGKDWKLEEAIKVIEDSYTFKNLAAGDYELKVLTALDWGKALGYGALSEKTEGLAAGENDNVTFTLAQAGDVVVTYIAGDPTTYTVKGNFYVPASDTYNTLRFVPNEWAEADAKIAAWIWGEKLDGQFTSFFAGEGDTLTVQINTKADSIIFVRFNSALAEPKWNNEYEKENEWTRIDKMKINTESLVFTITGWTAGTWDVFTRVDYILNNAGELAPDGAKIFVHTWGDGMADEDILMTEVKDGEDVVAYKAAINDLTQHLVFVRMYPEAEAIVWEGENKYWNKSKELARCVGNQAYFTGWEGDIFNVSCDEPTGFETIEQDVENGKVILDGVLYIIRDGKRYNAQGVEVK